MTFFLALLSDGSEKLLFGSIAGLFGFWLGWACASSRITAACRRLGGFYVGNTTYTCSATQTDRGQQSVPPPPPPPRPPRE